MVILKLIVTVWRPSEAGENMWWWSVMTEGLNRGRGHGDTKDGDGFVAEVRGGGA